MGEAMKYYKNRKQYLCAKASEVEAICEQLSKVLEELKEEFGVEDELFAMDERTPLEEKMYQDFDLQLYKIKNLFDEGLEDLIELAEQYDKEH
ncbi:MAG: hypothetical protein IJA19_05805 [Clostridia bacterium]|nr:hypothetical protein [Clostridia bacterium]